MIQNTISTRSAKRLYNLLGARYDLFDFYEGQAKEHSLKMLELGPGQSVLNVGVGTGKENLGIQRAIGATGRAHGLDLSTEMLKVSQRRSKSPLVEADGRHLPYADACFDRLYSAYTLDLIPFSDLPGMLSGFLRVLKPGGRMVLVTMTDGVTLPSRAFVSLWKLAYAITPISCGGCRPLQLSDLARKAGFREIQRDVIVQLSVPSEVLTALR